MNIVQRIEWRLYKERKKRKLKNLTPTIIASNCNGEFIYYDMNLKFRSPTEYSYAAEPPVQFRLSHLSRRSEPL